MSCPNRAWQQEGDTWLATFLPTLCKPLLSSAGVAQFFVGVTSHHPIPSGD